ncbi:MAG: ABC transporter permease [Chloroflexota bacterium]
MDDIQRGNLDFLLTKPENPQLLISIRTVAIWEMVNVIAGLIVLAVALGRLDRQLGLGQALAFVWLLLVGGVMIYCFRLILTTAAFWVVCIDEMANLFQGVFAAGRYPVGIYPGWLRNGLTFLVPVAFAVTVPSEALTGRLDWPTGLGATALAALFVVAARIFRRYRFHGCAPPAGRTRTRRPDPEDSQNPSPYRLASGTDCGVASGNTAGTVGCVDHAPYQTPRSVCPHGGVNPDEAFLWTPEMQASLRASDAYFASGQSRVFPNDEEFDAFLQEQCADG